MTERAVAGALGEAAPVEPLFKFRVRALPERLRLLRRWVQRAAELGGCPSEVASEVVIAVNEACMNVIQHAYHGDRGQDLVLEVEREGDELVFRVIDFATPADVRRLRPRDLEDIRPGGLGTHFMSELMDGWRYGQLEDQMGNFLELRKRIGG